MVQIRLEKRDTTSQAFKKQIITYPQNCDRMTEPPDTERYREWNAADSLLPLVDGELQLWRFQLTDDAFFPACANSLIPEERSRAERRRAGRPREEFAVGRACLRILLGNALGMPPLDIVLDENPFGKPFVANSAERISFNVSHSKGTILIGLSRQETVGVDVEHIDAGIDVLEIAQSAFTAKEIERLKALSSPNERRRAFYRCWTQKEAITKADGRGLSLPLSSFEVPAAPAWHTPVLIYDPTETEKLYFLSDIDPGDAAIAAVATDSPNCRILQLNFPLSRLSSHLVKQGD